MFDLETRDESIDLNRLKTLLCGRNGLYPLWTLLAHKILANHPTASSKVDDASAVNELYTPCQQLRRRTPPYTSVHHCTGHYSDCHNTTR